MRRRGIRAEDPEQSFEAFVHATAPQLNRTALLLTGDHHLAEDLTQATYAKVFASWRRVAHADNPLAYTRTTLLNTFLSQRRARSWHERPGRVEDVTSTLSARAADATVDADTQLGLLAALARLGSLDRAVLVARYWEDRSIAQTAHDLGISEAAVRTRSKRALDRLRPMVRELNTDLEGASR